MCFEVTCILIGHTIRIWNSSSGLSNSQLSHILSSGFIYLFLFVNYGKRQGTLKSNNEWRGEWRMARRTTNGERRSEQ